MKYLIVFFLISFINAFSQQIKIVGFTSDEVKVCITNNTDRDIMIGKNRYVIDYSIFKNDSLFSKISYLSKLKESRKAYAIPMVEQSRKIEKLMRKYRLSKEDAAKLLWDIQDAELIKKGKEKQISFKVFDPKNPSYISRIIDYNSKYYFEGTIKEYTDRIPNQYIIDLKKKGIEFLDFLFLPKTQIDIKNFYSNDLKDKENIEFLED